MDYIEEARIEAEIGLSEKLGGPFGAVIVKNGKIISRGCNRVLHDNDPTAHAEVVAIRRACKRLKTYNLSDCEIYTTSEPCPMCLSTIMWASIKTVYYATDRKDVAEIGFKDDFIYEYIKKPDNSLKKVQIKSKKCTELLEKYNNTIY